MAPITSIYAALLALLLLALGGRVVQRRLAGIPLGTGGDEEMEQRVRVHANLAEWAPIFLLLLLLSELGQAPVMLLHGAGTAFLAGRVLHAVGLTRHRARSFGRFYGSVISWTMIAVLSAYLLWRAAA